MDAKEKSVASIAIPNKESWPKFAKKYGTAGGKLTSFEEGRTTAVELLKSVGGGYLIEFEMNMAETMGKLLSLNLKTERGRASLAQELLLKHKKTKTVLGLSIAAPKKGAKGQPIGWALVNDDTEIEGAEFFRITSY